MDSKTIQILIAAGGTGGHIFPALFVASALKETTPNISIRFVGTGRPLEKNLIAGAKYALFEIKSTGVMGRGLSGALLFLVLLPKVLIQTFILLRKLKPDAVVGFGGYGSFFPVTIAALLGIPTWIHEAEASPGLANKILSFFASKVSGAFATTNFPKSKFIFTGHPIRPSLLQVERSKDLNITPHNILILGGSQGARAIDNVFIEMAARLPKEHLSIVHQTRSENMEVVKAAYEKHGVNADVTSFIDDIACKFSWEDIVVARSGAGSVAEVAAVNRPAIFIPLPTSQGGHQLTNAKVLSDLGKAIIVEEGADFEDRLLHALKTLLDKTEYFQMINRPGPQLREQAALEIAQGVLNLVSSN